MKNLRNSKTSGISLVALIVTIIVLIILTAAVIVTFMEGGIIDRAKEAVFKSDIRTYQEILAVKKAEEQIKLATGNGGESELNATELVDIQGLIPEFKEEYKDLIVISNGEMILGSREENPYSTWLADLGIAKIEEESLSEKYPHLNISDDGILLGFSDLVEKTEEYVEDDILYYSVPDKYKSIVIPEGIVSIADEAFYNCINLENVTIPNGVISIGEYAFSGTAISSIVLPSTVKEIGASAFEGCGNLTTINIPHGVEIINEFTFYGINAKNIVIPNSVKCIKIAAFSSNSFESVTIPSSVEIIEEEAFYEGSINYEEINTTYIVGSETVKELLLNSFSAYGDMPEDLIIVDTSIN
ncbi:MAG: leucine-rich repeat domain-containing protein [Clostridiales bacterium]|nr:leucine-rich repeat domain-containing protein [Clostridiales bacterium]